MVSKKEWLSNPMKFNVVKIGFVMVAATWVLLSFAVLSFADSTQTNDWHISLNAEDFKPVMQGNTTGAMDSRVIGVVSNQKTIEQASSSFVRQDETGSAFEVVGRVPDRRTMKWTLSVTSEKAEPFQYYLLRYKAQGICRDDTKFGVVLVAGKDASGNRVSEKLIDCSQVINDDMWHVVIGKKPINFTVNTVDIEVSTVDSIGSFVIGSLIFSSGIPDDPKITAYPMALNEIKNEHSVFEQLDITTSFNDTYHHAVDRVLSKHNMLIDGSNIFKSEQTSIGGVPFKIKTDGDNIATSPENNSVNQQQVDFLGYKVTRQYFFPVSRDDAMNISVDRKASELFLILVSEFPPAAGRYGLPEAPVFLNDIEMFSIELVYDEGESDFAFPYSIADQGFIVRRAVGAYVIPADANRKLKSMVFHNRFFGATVGVAAITLNTSPSRIFAQLVQEPEMTRVPQLPQPPYRSVYMQRDGDKINGGNSYYDFVINCQEGLAIEKLTNRWSAGTEQVLDANSGLQVIVGGQILTGRDFVTEKIDVKANQATVELKSKVESVPLNLTVSFVMDETSQLIMRLAAKNTSANSISPQIRFPYLENIRIGTLKDTWICFPQYRNVIDNKEGFHLASNDHAFPMQFYDIYNPEIGMGLAVITHNLKHNPMDYSVQKNSKGVSAFIQYPAEFYTMAGGQAIVFPETAIVSHHGDWRQATVAYQDWLKTWYKPHLSPKRDWFNKISLVKDYFLHETVSLRDLKVPSMYNQKSGEFQIKEYLEIDKKYWGGLSPDMMHFFHWSYLDEDKEGIKEYGQYDYDYFGGREKFKSALNEIQTVYKTPVSLYMVPDRCSTGAEVGKQLGAKVVKLRADGSQLANSTTWYVCPQQKDWLNWFVETAKKVQSDTNADVMYFDVVGFWRTNTCYSKEHEHPIPSWYNQTTYELVKKLRETLPPHVAIWTEYPLTDQNTQFTDGNITYYYLTLYELWTKSHDVLESAEMYSEPSMNLFRFIFPHVKQIDLPIGNERAINGMNRLKFTFFSGDAIYDNGWLSMTSRAREELMIKSVAIKKKYSDCFYSADITPLVPTECAKVYANKFVGKDKTVWTLYNSKYTTVRGPVLAIEHQEGATYYDVWNDRVLSPQIVDGRAIITQKLAPQALGCIVQHRTIE